MLLAGAGCTPVTASGAGVTPAGSGAASQTPLQAARAIRCLPPETRPAGVPLPRGFAVAAAVRCVQADRLVPGDGQWQFTLRQVARSGLGSLAAALRRPPARRPPNLICAAVGIVVAPFALVARDGRMLYPRLPADECGNPQPQVLAVLRNLHWVTVSARRGEQVQTEAGVRSGCAAGWKDMISLSSGVLPGRPLRPSPGGPVFASRPPSLRVCVYRDRAGPLGTFLTGGGRISGQAETALLSGISGGRASARCPQPHTLFAVLLPPGSSMPAYVEIGGCHRVLRPDGRAGQASPAALAVISRVLHPARSAP